MKKIIFLFALLLSLSAGAQDSLVVFFKNNSIELTPLALEKLEELKNRNAVIVRIDAFASNTGIFVRNSSFLAPGRGNTIATYLGFTDKDRVRSFVSTSPAATERKVVIYYTVTNTVNKVATIEPKLLNSSFIGNGLALLGNTNCGDKSVPQHVADSLAYYDSMSVKVVIVPTQCDSVFLVNQYSDNGYKFPAKIAVDTLARFVDVDFQLESSVEQVNAKLYPQTVTATEAGSGRGFFNFFVKLFSKKATVANVVNKKKSIAKVVDRQPTLTVFKGTLQEELIQTLKQKEAEIKEMKKAKAKKYGLTTVIKWLDLYGYNTIVEMLLQTVLFGDGVLSTFGNMLCGGNMGLLRQVFNQVIVGIATLGTFTVLHYAQKGLFLGVRSFLKLFIKDTTQDFKTLVREVKNLKQRIADVANICIN